MSTLSQGNAVIPGLVEVVQGSFHQGNSNFGYTAGIQCSCNTIVSICYAKLRKIALWKNHDLDFILAEGDEIFKRTGFTESPYVDQFPKNIQFQNQNCTQKYLILEGRFVSDERAINFICEELLLNHCGAIFVIDGYSVSVIFGRAYFYLFDSHSRDSNGRIVLNGTSVLLKFESLQSIQNYIRSVYKSNFFQLMYVKVQFENINIAKNIVAKNVKNRQQRILKRKRQFTPEKYVKEKERKREHRKHFYEKIKGTERHETEKEKMRQTRKRSYNEIRGTEKHDCVKEKMRQTSKRIFNYMKGTEKHRTKKEKMKENKKNSNKRVDKVIKFKKLVSEGPYYICISCNRCLYKRFVILYQREKYNVNIDNVFNKIVKTCNGGVYICLTCHKKLQKSEIPCQSVSNKLQLYSYPTSLCDISKLEHILIAQRILFSKVVIMHKGEFPKLSGAICNVPIENPNICEVLPRGSDINGVINVELKRKLSYKVPVISQQVRREKLETLLQYLKTHNDLYANVEVNFDNLTLDDSEVDFDIEKSTPEKNSDLFNKESVQITFVDDTTVPSITSFGLNENEFESDDPLNSYRTPASETVLISEIPNIAVDNENIILAPGEGKTPYSLINDDYCEELAHPHLFPTGRYGYKVEREIKLSPTKYFNQRLLNYTQKFSSDADYIFFAHKVLLQLNLKSKINIAMRKVAHSNVTAGMLGQNFEETVKNCVASDNAYKFMSTISGTPPYWQHMLSDVLAMVKQLGIPTYFMTLSCADLHWNELVIIIRKLKGENISDNEIKNLDYESRCTELNSNPVLLARHFQYRVETFFKEIVMNGQLGKITYYAIRVEFQVRGSPHVHCLLWANKAPKLTRDTKEEYIRHVDSVISVNFPSENDPPELKEAVKKFQIHSHSKTCKKYNKNECRFGFAKFFCKETIISEPLPDSLADTEKHEILIKRNCILTKVQNYIDEYLHPKKHNILDVEKPGYVEVPSIDAILNSMNLSYEEYKYYLSISPDKDAHLYIKRNPKSCFVNNYFSEGLLSWEANIDIQPVYDPYKAVTYMCAYFSKHEDKCSTAMKEAFKETKESDKTKFEVMKSIAKAYNSNRECSVQEAVYLTLPELWLRKCFPAIQFVNTNLPDKRYRIFKSKKEIEELPEDSDEVFKRNMLDRYKDRPNTTFLKGKYATFDSMCFATFCANYVLDLNKNDSSENDWQPIILDEIVNEINHIENLLPKAAPLMSSKEKLKCRKVPKVLRYYTPNKYKHPEKYAHHILMLFFPFRSEEHDLKESESYALKLSQEDVIATVNRNKEIFEPDGDLVDLVFENYQNDIQHNQDAFAQQENEEVNEFMNNPETESYDTDENEVRSNQDVGTFTTTNHNLSTDEEINSHIRSLNQKQREIFDILLNWAKKFVQNSKCKNPIFLLPIQMFLTGGGGVGKSHLIKCIFNCLSKILVYKTDQLEKPRVIKLAPTGIAAINIEGTTIHTGLNIPIHTFIPMSDKQRTTVRNKLMYVQLIIIDEISMVSSKLLLNIHKRLCEIFGVTDNRPFAGKSILVCGDLYQLPPVLAKPVFSTEGQMINAYKLWHLFKLAELNETMRQKGDNSFIDLLNDVRVGELTAENEMIIKSRFINSSNPQYPWNALHLFAENDSVNIHNLKMLESLPSECLSMPCIDTYPQTFSDREKAQVKNMKQSDTGGLSSELKLKVGARVMLIANIDIDDRLINGQLGTVTDFKIRNEKINVIYVTFDDKKAGLKAQSNDRCAIFSQSIPIERVEVTFSLNKRKSSSSPLIHRVQFPLMLSYACTVHKVQGLTLDSAVISFDLIKQRNFNPGQMYVAMSRVKSIEGLFFTGQYNRRAFNCNEQVSHEYTRLRMIENQSIPIKDFRLSDVSLNICLLNVRSLKRHAIDIRHDNFLKYNDILCLTETQIGYEHNGHGVSLINELLDNYTISYNNDQHKFNSLAVCHENNFVNIIEYDHDTGLSLIKFKKNTFHNSEFCLLLLYKNVRTPSDIFLYRLAETLRTNSVDLIVGDFNSDGLQMDNNQLVNQVLNDYQLQIDFPTHLDGGMLDHVYAHNDLASSFDLHTIRKCVTISDHDAVKIRLMVRE